MSEAERIAEKTYPPNEARAYLDGYNAALRAQEQNEPVLAYDSGETDTELGDVFICSNCEGRIYVIYDSENNYCPKCGKPITFDEDYAREPEHAPEKGVSE